MLKNELATATLEKKNGKSQRHIVIGRPHGLSLGLDSDWNDDHGKWQPFHIQLSSEVKPKRKSEQSQAKSEANFAEGLGKILTIFYAFKP